MESVLSLQNQQGKASTVRMKLVGGTPASELFGSEPLQSRTNYFVGNEPENWIANIPNFGKVHLRSVYPGVDLVYYGKQGRLEYDFVLAPHVDPRIVKLAFEGTRHIEQTREGDLKLTLASGEIVFHKPVSFQEIDGRRRPVASSYSVSKSGEVRFNIGSFDPSLPLVIDPALSFFNYFGGANDQTHDVALDSNGNAYVAGELSSPQEAFVARFDPSGNLLWRTFLGGNGQDQAFGIAVATIGTTSAVFVTGTTSSTNFLTIPASPLQLLNLGGTHAFITELDNGGTPHYSTYFGGLLGPDHGTSIRVPACTLTNACEVDVAGTTAGIGIVGIPVIGSGNGFVARLYYDSVGHIMTATPASGAYVSYISNVTDQYGSPSNSRTLALAISGNDAYVAGGLDSGPGFIQKLTNGASVYKTTLGSAASATYVNGIALDANANVYVTGSTYSNSTADLAPNCASQPFCQAMLSRGDFDAFYATLDRNGSKTYVTYLGSTGTDEGDAITLDPATGNILIAGFASSGGFPGGSNSPVQFPGSQTAFLTTFSPGNALLWTTFLAPQPFLGGTSYVSGVAADSLSNAYVTGYINNPFLAKVAPGTPITFKSMQLCSWDNLATAPLSPCTPTFALSQNPPLNRQIATGTLVLTGALTTGTGTYPNLQIQMLDGTGTPIDTTVTTAGVVIGTPASTDRITWTFPIILSTNPPPGGSMIELRTVINLSRTQQQTCSRGDATCWGIFNFIGIPGILLVGLPPSYTMASGTIVGGNTGNAIAALNASTSLPLTANLSSNQPAAQLVSPTVVIPAQSLSGGFSFTTSAVTTPTNAVITASLGTTAGSSFQSNWMTILPDLKLQPSSPALSFTILPAPPSGGVFGGATLQATVTLIDKNGNPTQVPVNAAYDPRGVPFYLKNGAAVMATGFFIPQGQSSATVTFIADTVTVTTIETIGAAIDQSVVVNASVSNTVALKINPVTVMALTVSPSSAAGGTTVTGTIFLVAPAATGGVSVALTPIAAIPSLPASVSVAGGATTGSFTFIAPSVNATTPLTLTASLNGTSATAAFSLAAITSASLTLNPSPVGSGGSVTASVTLNGPAPAGGVTVALSSTSGLATSISIGAGLSTGSATFVAPSPAGNTTYTISAALNGGTSTAPLSVITGTVPSIFSVTPSSVMSGAAVTASVTLNNASAGAATVVLTSTSGTLPSINIAAGQSSGSITFTAPAITAPTALTIAATLNGVTRTATLTVNPIAPISLTLSPTTATAGAAITGTLNLNAPATAGGLVVSLFSTSGTLASVNIAAGQSSGSATFAAPAVTTPTTFTISATLNGVTQTAPLTINPVALVTPLSLQISPATATAGTTVTGTLTLSAPAPAGGVVVPLSSTPGMLASISIAAGQSSGSATFAAPAVTVTTTFTVSSTLNGVAKTATLTVNPAATLTGIQFSPSTATSGVIVTGTATLSGAAPTGGQVVTLSSTFGTLPSIALAAVQSSGLVTFAAPAVTTTTTFTISATLNGVTKTATLTVNPAVTPVSDQFSPSTATAGAVVSGTIALSGAAPTGGLVVTLSSTPALSSLPASITVPAGVTSATFSFGAPSVTASTSYTIVAAANGVSISFVLNAVPAKVGWGYGYGIFATANTCGSINIIGNGSTDSYDSRLGSYTATRQNSGGNIGTNGNVILAGNVKVNGTESSPSTGTGGCFGSGTAKAALTLIGNSKVTGGLIKLPLALAFSNPAAPSPAPPTSNQYINSGTCSGIAGCTELAGKDVALAPGQYGNLNVTGGTPLHLKAGTYNINSITLTGSSSIVLDSVPVVVNLAGVTPQTGDGDGDFDDWITAPVLDFTAGSVTNGTGIASNFQILYAGTSSIILAGSAGAYGVVYAPNADILLLGNSSWFGGLVGQTITSIGNTSIHYDRSLGQ